MLVMPIDSSLELMSKPPASSKTLPGCLLSSTSPAKYKPQKPGSWLDPGNWRPKTEVTALPHSDQVPCQYDRVVFPPQMTYKVSIRDSDIRVGEVVINNKVMDSVGLRSVFRSQVGGRMFNVTRTVEVSRSHCEARAGCVCGTGHQEATICGYAGGDQCQETRCSSPLRPVGHCCYNYCGAVVNVQQSRVDMETLNQIARTHAGGHTQVYVRRLENSNRQIMLVPDLAGNLSTTHQVAAVIQNFLLMELDHTAVIWTEYSGASPPPGLFGTFI